MVQCELINPVQIAQPRYRIDAVERVRERSRLIRRLSFVWPAFSLAHQGVGETSSADAFRGGVQLSLVG